MEREWKTNESICFVAVCHVRDWQVARCENAVQNNQIYCGVFSLYIKYYKKTTLQLALIFVPTHSQMTWKRHQSYMRRYKTQITLIYINVCIIVKWEIRPAKGNQMMMMFASTKIAFYFFTCVCVHIHFFRCITGTHKKTKHEKETKFTLWMENMREAVILKREKTDKNHIMSIQW